MQTHKKRGRDGGRRRCVISVSMPEYDLDALDAIARQLAAWSGVRMTRSQVMRKLIDVGARLIAGQDVRRLR